MNLEIEKVDRDKLYQQAIAMMEEAEKKAAVRMGSRAFYRDTPWTYHRWYIRNHLRQFVFLTPLRAQEFEDEVRAILQWFSRVPHLPVFSAPPTHRSSFSRERDIDAYPDVQVNYAAGDRPERRASVDDASHADDGDSVSVAIDEIRRHVAGAIG